MSYSDPSPVGKKYVPGQIDKAEAFDGSDGETVTHSRTQTANGALALADKKSNDLPAFDNYLASQSQRNGIVINPNGFISDITVTIGGKTGEFDTLDLYVQDPSPSGTVHGQTTVTNNDTVTISGVNLQKGNDYWVVVGGSSDYNADYWDGSFPYSYDAADVVSGVNGGAEDTRAFAIDSLTYPKAVDGTTYISWPYPSDVYDWGAAFFEDVPDGETVNVYIEEYDGSAWNEIAGPIKNTTNIPGDPARNVRFRVEFSRASTANNPKLEQIARQEVFADA